MELLQTLLLVIIAGLILSRSKNKFSKPARSKRHLVMDTSGLIDGRILYLAKAGFVPEEIIVPQFIIAELQLLADGNDSQKRERARFGLDMARELQSTKGVKVTLDRTNFDIKTTDDKLVALAKKLSADLYTTDFNLNKVATIEGVRVLNVNELAQSLRPLALPGEHKTVKIIQKGSNRNQGVGYLDDGTMVVVDGAANMIGKTVKAEVNRIHQTVAGKMMFANLTTRTGQTAHPPRGE